MNVVPSCTYSARILFRRDRQNRKTEHALNPAVDREMGLGLRSRHGDRTTGARAARQATTQGRSAGHTQATKPSKTKDAHEFEADERVVAGAQAVAVDLADGGRLADDAAVDHRLVVQLRSK
jgi:hypothetical protein